MDYQFGCPNLFCPRHKGMGNSFVRCAHKGTRFVSQVMGYFDFAPEKGIVDYVDDAITEWSGVQAIGYFNTMEEANAFWAKGLELLESDTPVERD